ncbi:MAG: hypothetical protein ACXV98_08075 [Ilumatobacteraceae bacterium]
MSLFVGKNQSYQVLDRLARSRLLRDQSIRLEDDTFLLAMMLEQVENHELVFLIRHRQKRLHGWVDDHLGSP